MSCSWHGRSTHFRPVGGRIAGVMNFMHQVLVETNDWLCTGAATTVFAVVRNIPANLHERPPQKFPAVCLSVCGRSD
jgi:hypothetical protein